MRKAIRRELEKTGPSYITNKYASGRQVPYKSNTEENQDQNGGVSESESDLYLQETANALAELEQEIFLGDYTQLLKRR